MSSVAVNFAFMKPIFEKQMAITLIVLKQKWITTLKKVKVQTWKSCTPFLIAIKRINRKLDEPFLFIRQAFIKKQFPFRVPWDIISKKQKKKKSW